MEGKTNLVWNIPKGRNFTPFILVLASKRVQNRFLTYEMALALVNEEKA